MIDTIPAPLENDVDPGIPPVPTDNEFDLGPAPVIPTSSSNEWNEERSQYDINRRVRKRCMVISAVIAVSSLVLVIVLGPTMDRGSNRLRGDENEAEKATDFVAFAPTSAKTTDADNKNYGGDKQTIKIGSGETNFPTGSPWVRVGEEILGLAAMDFMGVALALNGKGNRIIVGANGNDIPNNIGILPVTATVPSGLNMTSEEQEEVNATNAIMVGHAQYSRGHVRVFDLEKSEGEDDAWKQIGEDILAPPVQLDADDDADFGGLPYDLMGSAVAISADGLTIATGAPLADGGKGAVFCFRLNVDTNGTGSWLPRGSHLPGNSFGDTPLDVSGYVSLSDDGNTVAVGEPAFASRSGRVRVYMWNTDDEDWKKVGKSLFSENLLDQFGYAVDLNGDGTRLVASAPNREADGMEWESLETGHVRIYDLVSGQWLVAKDIMGDGTRDENFGESVSISSDGNVVAIGAPNGFVRELLQPREGGSLPGSVAVYENLNEEWVLRGGSHIDIAEGFFFGHDVAVNADGSRVVSSAMGFVMGGRVVSPSMVFAFDYVKDAGKDEGTWVQSGNSIYHGYLQNDYGREFTDLTGFSIDISDNGEIVGVGSPFQINDDMQLSGHATVYQDPFV
eukprot:CAMPEP_0194271988 /NCGR_PEP_ID=MMETSP0169-20130528/5661_1 /TAXON_ID=218684 /ORGANISM="Corethron pennatum, Strain L29A3" /LENGTH=621 /DNA_ID=CAMNT_0039014519 /DNA_START=51 /DNA_END=1916 /DNA_ORIENTATION=-